MKKELKKYIKQNLVKETKKCYAIPSRRLCVSFKDIFFEDDECSEKYNIKEISNSKKEELEVKQKIYDYEEEHDFDIKEELSKDYDIDVPQFIQHWQAEEESNKNIKMYLEKHQQSNFQKTLFRMIDERNLKDSDVYNKVHLDRRLFSKIRNDEKYHPSKETVILLGLSLELSEKEIDELLSSASYSLPKNNYYDLIIRFCFINKIYRIIEVNELLDEYNCELFDY